LISFTTGVLVWLALEFIGVDFAVTWGALAFFLNFIPTVGSILASIPPVLLALVQFYPSFWPAVITLLSVTTIQMGMGNALAPKILPIAAAIKIVCENIETLHPISVMMGSGKAFRREFKES
jgi:predicted PurR-regulated permease PerM